MTSSSDILKFSIVTQIDEFKNLWEQEYPNRATGGLQAIAGFEHQFLLMLLKLIYLWRKSTELERQNSVTATKILTEAISDITESNIDTLTFIQVKRTLSSSAIDKALEELWDIFNLALNHNPSLVDSLRFVISGKIEDAVSPTDRIAVWGSKKYKDRVQDLTRFKKHVSYELVSNPREDLAAQLGTLGLDENSETTISRWLGYLLQLGSGFSSESISRLIWQELIHDRSLVAFQSTIARLFSRSRSRLSAILATLGDRVILPVAQLSNLQTSIVDNKISLLIGPSGSGKSALCKISIQQHFKESFDCLLLQASDIFSFTESSDVTANRGLRRLDELLVASVMQKPVLIVIDDLSDADDLHFEAVLNLLQNTLTDNAKLTNIRFILVTHLDAKQRVNEKIVARFGKNFVCPSVELPQLPIRELQLAKDLPTSVISLIDRHREFGPALNLKLVDWLVRSDRQEQLDVSVFRNDLDLLTWFWRDCIRDGRDLSDSSQALIKIAGELASRFTPDLPLYFDPSIKTETLRTLVRRDCLRVIDERLTVTHRFVGDCARFYYLRANIREIECQHLVEWLKNPFWVQPIRWLMLQLAIDSPASETWEELISEALEGKHLQLLDLLLDGAILSKQPDILLDRCPHQSLPFIIERLIVRLLAIATDLNPLYTEILQSVFLPERISIEAKATGIPKVDLWEPVWRWLLAQTPEILIAESCIFFKAAEVWLSWHVYAKNFPLCSEVANFTLDLARRVLLPDPDPEASQISRNIDIDEWIELKQKGLIPQSKPSNRKYYYLGDFESNAFGCIVLAIKIIPERSSWFLRVLAGREIVPANKLEPTEVSRSIVIPGIGVLAAPHPSGPQAKVNHRFRKFMLDRGGLYLDCVMRFSPDLGAELLLALTIEPPSYQYEEEDEDDSVNDDWGTSGSHEIDVCTFKFTPLRSLLERNEALAIDIVATLSKVATEYWHQHRWLKGRLEGSLATDTDGITIIVDGDRKFLKGGRHALYWHRKYPFCPRILACLLMTLEGWLYSRPTRSQLEKSISLVFQYADTVAMVGVLVSLAKCDPRLLREPLLPLLSSIQLLVWLELDPRDGCHNYTFDLIGAQKLLPQERQELFNFHNLQYRHIHLSEKALQIWLYEVIVGNKSPLVLNNWDEYQLDLVPKPSEYQALKIRIRFDPNNWNLIQDDDGNSFFNFIGSFPKNSEVESQAEIAMKNIQHLDISMIARQVIDGEQEKTLELHERMISLLTSEEHSNYWTEDVDRQCRANGFWGAIAIILEPPFNTLNQELQAEINHLAEASIDFPIALDRFNRCQGYNLDANAFIAHTAPRLIRNIQSSIIIWTNAIFRCFIGVCNGNTSAFMKSWLKEYGLEHPLTPQLINLAPLIARLISLTHSIAYAKLIQTNSLDDGSYIVPRPEEIDYEVCQRENPEIEAAWLNLQSDFVEGKIPASSIVDALDWIPDVLIQLIQQLPDWLQNQFFRSSLDWRFLNAALVPVLKSNIDSDRNRETVASLCDRVLQAFLHKRENVYKEYKSEQDSGRSDINLHIYDRKEQLIDAVVLSKCTNPVDRVKALIARLKSIELRDYILLGHIVDTLSYSFIDCENPDLDYIDLKEQIALIIGEYLCESNDRQETSLRIIGDDGEVWGKTIELLTRESRIKEDAAHVDRSLTRFFERFQDVLFPWWGIRKQLYPIGQTGGYRQFRHSLFKAIVRHQELLSSYRDDENKLLVRVLAELWDSDRQWIVSRQSRLQDLRKILEPLQEIDVTGARILADRVASSLSNLST
jgi:ATPase family associated with various cellular activities (AAA)